MKSLILGCTGLSALRAKHASVFDDADHIMRYVGWLKHVEVFFFFLFAHSNHLWRTSKIFDKRSILYSAPGKKWSGKSDGLCALRQEKTPSCTGSLE